MHPVAQLKEVETQKVADMKRKHRIMYVEKPAQVGGSVTGLYQLVQGLDRRHYEPIVLFHGPNPYRKQFRQIGVPVLTLSESPGDRAQSGTAQEGNRAKRPSRDIAASLGRYSDRLAHTYRLSKEAYLVIKRDRPIAKRVVQLIQQNDIDLVHHNNSLPVNRATALAARMAGLPQISHVRDLSVFCSIDRYIGESVTAFVYMSRAIESLYTNLGIPASKGKVIYDAFDLEVFGSKMPDPAAGNNGRTASRSLAQLKAELGIEEHDWVISNVGRLDWWKGQDYFLQAISQVVRSFPNVKALLIGAPDASAVSQAFAQKLERMVDELRLSKHVVFTGFRSDVPQLMSASDIVVHSSSEPEPFGRVIVEAMLVGCPVVATEAGGPLDIVQDQVTGLLVPPKDAPAMAQALERLLQDRKEAEAMGRQARSQAQQRFTIEQHIKNITDLYQEILSTRAIARRTSFVR